MGVKLLSIEASYSVEGQPDITRQVRGRQLTIRPVRMLVRATPMRLRELVIVVEGQQIRRDGQIGGNGWRSLSWTTGDGWLGELAIDDAPDYVQRAAESVPMVGGAP